MATLKIGTRGSALALVQADMTERALAAAHPGIELERVVVKTIGDKRTDLRFSEFGAAGEGIVDKGIFTKELEEALAAGTIDLAVHSLKDVPTELADGYRISTVLPRAAIEDVLISKTAEAIEGLPGNARVGTSSVRRIRQLQDARPDIEAVEIRGNVPTRIQKLLDGDDNLDAIMLARAGLDRLGIFGAESSLHYHILDPQIFLPAASQGAVGIEVHRCSGDEVPALLEAIHCTDTGDRVIAERAFLDVLKAGCDTPVGVVSELYDNGDITLHARLFPDDPNSSDPVLEGEARGPRDQPEEVAKALLKALNS